MIKQADTGHSRRFAIKRRTFLMGLALIFSVLLSGSQVFGFAYEDRSTLTLEPASAVPGQEVVLEVRIPLEEDLHVYGPDVEKPYFATKLTVTQQGPITWNAVPDYPPVSRLDVMGESVVVLSPDRGTGEVILPLRGKIKADASAGSHAIEVSLTYQTCSETMCFPPVIENSLTASVEIVPVSGADVPRGTGVDPASGTTDIPPPQDVQITDEAISVENFGTSFSLFGYRLDLSQSGLWLPLMIAFAAGLILNVMPCVLPVIPLKILQLTRQAQQEHHSPVKLSLVFSLGIIVFFLAIGVVAVLLQTGFAWGQPFQNPTFLIGICLVLILMALGMFDLYQFQVPSFIANREVVQNGYLGSFSMGFLAGILSTPCSFGLLGAAVAWAQTQSQTITLLAFLTIGLGMAFPYVVLSSFPGLLDKMPKAGRWSEMFKQSMGFVLLGVVAFFISALPKDRLFSTLLFFIVFSFLVWVWGKALEFRTNLLARTGKVFVISGIMLSGWFMLQTPTGELEWKTFNAQNLKEAQESGNDYLVKFTADWCMNCRTVDYRVFGNNRGIFRIFRNNRVIQKLTAKEVTLIKADLTQTNEFAAQYLNEWTGQTGIPFTVLFKSDGTRILLPGVYSPNDLLKELK